MAQQVTVIPTMSHDLSSVPGIQCAARYTHVKQKIRSNFYHYINDATYFAD